MASDESFLHIVRVDIDPEHEAAFSAWYEQTHKDYPEFKKSPAFAAALARVRAELKP